MRDGGVFYELDVAQMTSTDIERAFADITDEKLRSRLIEEHTDASKAALITLFWERDKEIYIKTIPQRPRYRKYYQEYCSANSRPSGEGAAAWDERVTLDRYTTDKGFPGSCASQPPIQCRDTVGISGLNQVADDRLRCGWKRAALVFVTPGGEVLPIGGVCLQGLLGVAAFHVDTGTGEQVGDGGRGLSGCEKFGQ
jgi:hypothetical protein